MNKNIQEVMNLMASYVMNNIQTGISYDWDNAFSYKEVKESYSKVKKEMADKIGDIRDLTVDELKVLGFKPFSKDKPELLLAPLWIFDLIKDGTELTCINGEKVIKGKDYIDLDVRGGSIAYGVIGK